ncbi:hypothetical protein KJA17_01645 [Patescibacteria group bacterium]|nr:hypothetical protein [Patescibacteria group bacterium]
MKVKILRGFGCETTEEKQAEFLREFKDTLRGFGLPVSEISSEKKTGGPISLEVPDHLELNEITRSLASFAEVLARQERRDVYFGIYVPQYDFQVTVAGAA